MGKRSQNTAKDSHQNQYQSDNPANNTQRLLFDQPDKEISQPGTSLWLTYC